MEVNVHHAKTHLSKLIAAAESGEEVVIARDGKPAVKLVLVAAPGRKSRKQMLGAGIGKLWMADDAFCLKRIWRFGSSSRPTIPPTNL